jgi:outer membrane protein OmpA-like peptidoglycan-associated protein
MPFFIGFTLLILHILSICFSNFIPLYLILKIIKIYMKYHLFVYTLLLPIFFSYQLNAQYPNIRTEYIEKHSQIAVDEMLRTGVLASITLAQGILESNSGLSNLAKDANNHFGVKCGGNWHGKTYKMSSDDHPINTKPIQTCYRKYKNVADSYRDHSDILAEPIRYAFLFQLNQSDYRSWCQGLQSAGYAMANTYASTLINIIQTHRLFEFDKLSMGNTTNRRYVSKINKIPFVLSKNNETLSDIANISRKSAENLENYNEYEYKSSDTLKQNTRIFIQKKKKKWSGRIKYHLVQKDQTMFEIAQLYGVDLKSLLKRNNIGFEEEPIQGVQIKLRGFSFKKPNKPPVFIPIPKEVKKIFTFPSGLLFDIGQSELKPDAYPALQELVLLLLKNPRSKANILGHTDNTGSSEINLLLSEKRALAVLDYLVVNNINWERLAYKGLGETKPIVDNSTEGARTQNRRVEVEIR